MKPALTLRAKFLAFSLGLMLILGAGVIIFVHTTLNDLLFASLQKRGASAARHMAEAAASPILTENTVALQLLLYDEKNQEDNIEYIFVISHDRKLLAHTFGAKFPQDLVKIAPPSAGKASRVTRLETEKGVVYDVAVPVLAGELGTLHAGISAEVVNRSVSHITGITTWVVLGILLVCSIMAIWFAKALTRPLVALREGAEAIGSGNLQQRLDIKTGDEIGQLADAFNRMADNLQQTTVSRNAVEELNRQLESAVQKRTGELADANISLLQEVAERKSAETNVRRLNEELEERVAERTAQYETSNRELESFCYSVSHDLRAPLRHINGYSRILLEDYAPSLNEEGRNFLQRICTASSQMGLLIDDLLELSRVSRGELLIEKVDLGRFASQIVAQLREGTPERSVELVISDGLVAEGDPRLLHLVLQNLLENAWKYTARRTDAKIEFERSEKNGKQSFVVRDNGIGFDMAYAGKLYRPFQRLVDPKEFAGTGVGLATVKRIVERHGGEVWAEGVVGRGADFYFTLG